MTAGGRICYYISMHISVKCSAALHCLIFINEYGKDKRVTSGLIAASSGVNPVTVRTIMSALKKSGIISVKKGVGGAAICADPEKISLFDIWKAVDPSFSENLIGIHSSPSQLCPVGRKINETLNLSYAPVKDDFKDSLKSVTLKNVFDNYKKAQNSQNSS